jgi:hypothetical protein
MPAGAQLHRERGTVDASAATVTTDQLDYSPGTTVVITGSGWEPGETIVLVLHEEPQLDPDLLLTAVADDNGDFTNTDLPSMRSMSASHLPSRPRDSRLVRRRRPHSRTRQTAAMAICKRVSSATMAPGTARQVHAAPWTVC